MAVPTVTKNMTVVTVAETSIPLGDVGWYNIGGGAGSAFNTDIFRQGNQSRSRRIDNTIRGFGYDMGTNRIPLSAGDHVFFWINVTTASGLNTIANGGVQIRLGSGTTETADNRTFYVLGSDTYPLSGGWVRVVVDPQKSGSIADTGTFDPTDIRFFTLIFDMADVGGTAPNCFMDSTQVGTGITVTGGTPGDKITWADISAESEKLINAFGAIEERSGVFFCRGKIIIGDSSADTYFDDEDKTLIWEPTEYHDGTSVVSAVADTLNELRVTGDAGNITDFINGNKVGTGDTAVGANGCIYQASASGDVNLKVDMSNANVENIEVYGTTFLRCIAGGTTGSSVLFSSDATNAPNHDVIGCVFDQCGEIDLGRVVARNDSFSGTQEAVRASGNAAALLWNANIDIKNCSFFANTAGTSAHAIEHPVAGTFTYAGLTFSGNTKDLLFSPASGNLIVNATAGSDPSTFTNLSSGSVTINNAKTLTLTGLIDNSEVRIYQNGTEIEEDGIEDTSGGSFAYIYNFPTGFNVDIVVHAVAYEHLRLSNVVLGATDASLPIQQQFDRNYSNP